MFHKGERKDVFDLRLEAGLVLPLTVDRQVDFGFFLTNDYEDVLLHKGEILEDIQVGDEIEVFLYNDKQGRLSATMKIPTIRQDVYDWCEVVDSNEKLGVFVSIGLKKDILVSADDLPKFDELWPAVGDQLYMTLKTDRNGLLYGKLATENVIDEIRKPAPKQLLNQDIEGRVYRVLRVGSFLITEEGYRCFIHESEREEEPRLGSLMKARVIDVKDDGNVNASFLPRKQEKMSVDAEKIYAYMETRAGAMPYGDKTQPDIILDKFSMSKGAFKRALGQLMKNGRVYQEDGWTYFSERK
ncbi:hypothetical protein Q73_07065 [Bacillus coahuilensis m2-6]|uniref:CvfB family protein n=1 Tax=Bacillus coahuilensis TaxID=408580 RepID=UPI0007503E9F|nr:S1-like domain-containing RNA-binding protein [Bacillus coahuilensis]KUP08267.1 hypothetical protein Q73_07065 [Bacillus coahuilensis m2-6]